MSKSKLLFIIISIVFVIILIIFAIDISSRTTFPGKKKPAIEQIDNDSTVIEQESIN